MDLLDGKEMGAGRRRPVLGDGRAQERMKCATGLPDELVDLIAEFDYGIQARVDGEKVEGRLDFGDAEHHREDYLIALSDAIGKRASTYSDPQWETAARGVSYVLLLRTSTFTDWVWMLGFTRDAIAQMIDVRFRKWFYELQPNDDCDFIVVDDLQVAANSTTECRLWPFSFGRIDKARTKHLNLKNNKHKQL